MIRWRNLAKPERYVAGEPELSTCAATDSEGWLVADLLAPNSKHLTKLVGVFRSDHLVNAYMHRRLNARGAVAGELR